jgi:hypothetical protein
MPDSKGITSIQWLSITAQENTVQQIFIDGVVAFASFLQQ